MKKECDKEMNDYCDSDYGLHTHRCVLEPDHELPTLAPVHRCWCGKAWQEERLKDEH